MRERVEHPDRDHEEQQRVDGEVDVGRGERDAADARAAVDEDRETEQGGASGERAGDRRDEVIGVFVDPDRARRALRDQDPQHMAADRGERAVVKQRASPLEQSPLEQLGGAGGPSELVVAVAPDVAEDEDRDRDVRDHDPQEDVAGAHRRASTVGMTSGGANGSSPTSSCGGPCASNRSRLNRSPADRPPTSSRPRRARVHTGLPAPVARAESPRARAGARAGPARRAHGTRPPRTPTSAGDSPVARVRSTVVQRRGRASSTATEQAPLATVTVRVERHVQPGPFVRSNVLT